MSSMCFEKMFIDYQSTQDLIDRLFHLQVGSSKAGRRQLADQLAMEMASVEGSEAGMV